MFLPSDIYLFEVNNRVCSTSNFLSPIFSPYLLSLGHVTSRVSVGVVQSKNCYFMYTYTFLAFFYCFSSLFFSFFFSFRSIKFPQQNLNQSETGIGDKNLSVKLHDRNTRTMCEICSKLTIKTQE